MYDPPRRILGRIAGVTLREMAWNRELTYACGEPGGVFHSLLPELGRNTARRVLGEAAKTGADVLVTACPATLTSLQQANRTSRALRDLVEVAADAVAECPGRIPELSSHRARVQVGASSERGY